MDPSPGNYRHHQPLNPNTDESRTETTTGEQNLTNTGRRQQPPPRALQRLRDLFMKMAEKLTPSQTSFVGKRFDDYFYDFHIPDHPPYAAMIQRAIRELNEEGGSNEESISKFIREKYLDLPKPHVLMLKKWLGKLCETGEIVVTSDHRYLLGYSNSTHISSQSPSPSLSPSSSYNPSSSSSGTSSPSPKIKQWKKKGKRLSRRGRQYDEVDQEKSPGFKRVNITQALDNQGHGGPQLPGGRGRGRGQGRGRSTMMTPEDTVASEHRGRGRPRKSKVSNEQNVGSSQMQDESGYRGGRGRPKRLDF